jgi:hypothetical protein
MRTVRTRIRVAPDGTLTGYAAGLPTGEHEAEIMLTDSVEPAARSDVGILLSRVRAIQKEVARLPVLDERSPDEIIGYNSKAISTDGDRQLGTDRVAAR